MLQQRAGEILNSTAARQQDFSFQAAISQFSGNCNCLISLERPFHSKQQHDNWTLSCRLSPRRPKLDLQVKSAINDVGSPELIHYPLKRKNYDDLILTNLLTRRLLVLVVLPPQPEAWLSVSPEQLVLRRCAYWCSLAGFPESANESSVTVHVARANLFDVAALTGLMQEINEGGVS
jgi:hypothetical protein